MTSEELKRQHDFLGICGLKKSTVDKRDYSLTYQTAQVIIPDEFRLESPNVIKDQGQTSMCASFSSSYIAEHLNKLTANKYTELSPSFVYANRVNQDSEGMELRDAEKILINTGICRNELFNKIETEPQLNIDYNNSNPDNLIKDAVNYKTVSFAQINSINDAKIALIQHGYLHIGVPWYQDNQLNYDIKLSDNNPYKKDGYISQLIKGMTLEGYHALTLIGFSKKYNGWWCVNSWGSDYANNGVFILPYDYPIDSCFAVIGKVGEPSNANTITSNITPTPVTPIISKKSDNEFLQTLWKILNYIINKLKRIKEEI